MRISQKSLVLVAVLLAGALFSVEARAGVKIGILMFSNEARYLTAAKGFMDKLREEDFGEPKTKFMVENAGANKAKAAELVRKFAAAKMDLIFTLGTSASLAVSQEIKDVPIVFSVVYDPVAVGLARSWKNSGNNTTGTASKVPMSKLMDSLKAFMPVKRLAVLYTPGERNSELILKDLQEIQGTYKIKVVPVPLTREAEVAEIMPEVIRTSDAIYMTGSNLVDSEVSLIVDMATRGKVVTITHLEDLVEKGILLGVCPDLYAMGRLAGERAIKILKGAKPSSIPIAVLKKQEVIINMRTAKEGQFRLSPEFMKTVTRKIK
ncbi:MAG: ABC transporter substrate-binding protein [Dissulfurispiraceae bacterium]